MIAGEILWTAGTRGGVIGDQKLKCTTPTSLANCYIGRFGWLGDRVSLEDQVANAAFIEMNMTTPQGYKALYGNGVRFRSAITVPIAVQRTKMC